MKRLSIILAGLIVLLTACAPAASPPPTTAPPTDTAPPPTEGAAAPATTPAQEVFAARPAWQLLPLRDARTGESFSFADFAGQTVYVHPMATWCTNCRASQRSLRDNVVPQVNNDEVVFVSLDIETASQDDVLASYAENNSFPWRFTVATPELIAGLVEAFGPSVTVPPSQPHFIIRPDGSTTGLMTGNPTPDEVLSQLQEAAGAA